MTVAYIVEPLDPEKVDQAYPLIHAVEPRLDRAEWRQRCNNAGNGKGLPAVLVARGPNDHFHGLCIVESTQNRSGLPAAAVSNLVIDSVIDPAGVASALFTALVRRIASAGLNRLVIFTAGTDETALTALARARADLPPVALTIELV
jgi:hypothetical protein